jgi:hypothetical protein
MSAPDKRLVVLLGGQQSELPGRLLDRVASRAKACQAALSGQ